MKTFVSILMLLFFCTQYLIGATYTSDGSPLDWSDPDTWGTADIPGDWDGDIVNINHNITYTGDLTAAGRGAITIASGCTLTVTGYLYLNATNIVIDAGGVLNVGGVFKGYSGAGSMTNNGKVITGGQFLSDLASYTVTNTGTIECASFKTIGTFTNSGNITTTTTFEAAMTAGNFTSTGGTITAGTTLTLNCSGRTFALTGTTVNVGSDFIVTNGNITTDASSPVTIGNDYLSGADAACSFGGSLSVGRDLTNTQGANITLEGTCTVGRNASGSGSGDYIVNGTLNITGSLTLTNSAIMSGTGNAGWGSANVNDQTSDGAVVCNGTRYDTDPGVLAADIPNNPINLVDCSAGTLPVELIAFSAKALDSSVELTWVTGSEINNSHFEILASEDGVDWKILGSVIGAGNSNEVNAYTFTVTGGKFRYFKLMQVDVNGFYTYSPVLCTRKAENTSSGISIFPNPVSNVLTINAGKLTQGKYKMTINELWGKSVEQMTVNINDSNNSINILVAGLTPGIYIISFENEHNEVFRERFLKK